MSTEQNAWWYLAACQQTDGEELFAEGTAQASGKRICATCQVRTECLAHALDRRIDHGVWGGMTERERRSLLRRRPRITSWSRLLEEARAAHERNFPTGARPGRDNAA
ncbi:WhiB family transcriptional regulator [Streptomyces sp. NPDC097727]|uniref:WhiB family transcriptional regulator n=1 Tax=Streptomyces sp. NPDC097727 TaxID=3366092 RepID=UPI003813637B